MRIPAAAATVSESSASGPPSRTGPAVESADETLVQRDAHRAHHVVDVHRAATCGRRRAP